jgi:methionyl-tRNA formyltransferase
LSKQKYKVTFLLDKSNIWIEKYLKKYNFKLNNKYIFKIKKNPDLVKNQDLVFPLAYTKILSENFLNNNKLTLIVHASRLPKDKGFAPVQNQVLRNKKKIFISLIKAAKNVDAGHLFLRDHFILKGYELFEEIRYLQAMACLKIISKFLNRFPKVKCVPQVGKSNFNKKRVYSDSKLNINKSIKTQFNLLRICDNYLWPAYFIYKKNKYTLKIFRSNFKINF